MFVPRQDSLGKWMAFLCKKVATKPFRFRALTGSEGRCPCPTCAKPTQKSGTLVVQLFVFHWKLKVCQDRLGTDVSKTLGRYFRPLSFRFEKRSAVISRCRYHFGLRNGRPLLFRCRYYFGSHPIATSSLSGSQTYRWCSSRVAFPSHTCSRTEHRT
jgi:hypothetical protein